MDSEIRGILGGRKGGEWRRGKVEIAESSNEMEREKREEKKTREGGKIFGLRINMWREVASPNIIIKFPKLLIVFLLPAKYGANQHFKNTNKIKK